MRARILILTFCCALAVPAAPNAVAAVPQRLAWQGVALDSLDVPLADGSYMFSFSIWSSGDGGDSLWGESRVIDVENGVLNVLLGEVVPVSDSVFDAPGRWLQVQFESEDPYSPRTEIVSVGYAFRVGSLDGATGGEVSSNIDMKNFATVPRLRLFREGTSTVIGEMAGGGAGGRMTLYDETGVKTLELDPGPGDGGRFVLWTHPALSTGIAMENTGNDNPYLLLQGQSAIAYLSMDSVGDPSVVLPPSSISSGEILDEPGIAVTSGGSLSITSSTMADVATVSISTPTQGYVVVEGKCYLSFTGTTLSNKAYVQIDETAGGSQQFPYTTRAGMDSYPNTGEYLFPVYVSRVYSKPQGSYTFRMEANELVGSSGSRTAFHAILAAQFFPKSYGAVSTVVSSTDAQEFDEAVLVSGSGPELGPNSQAGEMMYQVDLRELELRAARAEEAANAARLEVLKARLKQAATESPRTSED